MELDTYAIEHEIEQDHWWFVGRRYLFCTMIEKLNLPKNAVILDVGSSSGTNLRMLKEMGFTHYKGLDFSEESKRFCAEKGLGEVMLADIQKDDLPESTYDLILATDVLEHLSEDLGALERIQRSLKPGGHVLITVPCFQSLWGPQDILAQHLRRYKLSQVLTMVGQAGLIAKKSFYFNYFLFLPIWLARKILLKAQKIQNENTLNSPIINSILKLIFKIDCWSSPLLRPPFGVSAFVMAQKV